jgi:hypothetical protein
VETGSFLPPSQHLGIVRIQQDRCTSRARSASPYCSGSPKLPAGLYITKTNNKHSFHRQDDCVKVDYRLPSLSSVCYFHLLAQQLFVVPLALCSTIVGPRGRFIVRNPAAWLITVSWETSGVYVVWGLDFLIQVGVFFKSQQSFFNNSQFHPNRFVLRVQYNDRLSNLPLKIENSVRTWSDFRNMCACGVVKETR